MADRRFTEEEAREIFERAAQRERDARATGKPMPVRTEGYSLAELEEIASEAGLAPEFVAAAATELSLSPEANKKLVLSRVPAEINELRIVSTDIADKEWQAMVYALREEFRVNGQTAQFGDAREWVSSNIVQDGTSVVKMRVDPSEGRTTLALSQSMKVWDQLAIAFGASLGGSAGLFSLLFALGDFNKEPWALPIIFAIVGASALIGFPLIGRSAAKRVKKKFRRIMDRMELLARSSDAQPAPQLSGESE